MPSWRSLLRLLQCPDRLHGAGEAPEGVRVEAGLAPVAALVEWATAWAADSGQA